MKKYFNFIGRVWMRATSGSFLPEDQARRSPLLLMSYGRRGSSRPIGNLLTLLDEVGIWMTPHNFHDIIGGVECRRAAQKN